MKGILRSASWVIPYTFLGIIFPQITLARQPVACDFVAVDANGTVVQQQHSTVWPGEMDKCKNTWVPLGVTFCNTHSLPAAWQIRWNNDTNMPLLQRECPAPGQPQTFPCAFNVKNVFGQVTYQNTGQAVTEDACMAVWNTAITNTCKSQPGATHETYFNWTNKLIRTARCSAPTSPAPGGSAPTAATSNTLVKPCAQASEYAKYSRCWGWHIAHTYDLGQVFNIKTVSGSIYAGPSEAKGAAYSWQLRVSTDGTNWSSAGTVNATGATTKGFGPISVNRSARYVQIFTNNSGYVDNSEITVIY